MLLLLLLLSVTAAYVDVATDSDLFNSYVSLSFSSHSGTNVSDAVNDVTADFHRPSCHLSGISYRFFSVHLS